MAALTVNHQNGNYQPAYNDNIYVVTDASGYSSNYNYKFIADIKTSGGALITRLKFPIHYQSSTQGVVNIARVLEDYVTHDWNYNDTAASGCTNSFYDYKVDFGYEYSTGTTSPIVQTTGVTSVTGTTVWNGYINPIDWVNYDLTDYLMASGSTAQFLTNNNAKRIHRNQKDWLYLLNDGTINTISVSFSPSGSVNISCPTNKVIRIPIGSNISGGIPSGTTSYTITPKNSGGSAIGSVYTITIDDRCSKYNTTDLFFLNRLGGVESFRFDMIRRDAIDIIRKSYKSNPYALSGGVYSYGIDSHSKSNYYTEANERITLNSNNITEAEAIWLKELVMSPRVWLYDGTLKAVNITTSQYEERKHINDKVFNLQLEIETSIPDKSQRL